jgi:hypothetical protein
VTQLHQLLAVEAGAKKAADKALTDAYHAIQRGAQLNGLARSYAPMNEDGEPLPDEYTLVQVKVPAIIESLKPALARLLDVTATKDVTNLTATANVVLEDGTVVLEEVPATFLLWLEKRVEDLSTFISKLPTLDPAKEWDYDANTGAYRAKAEQTIRTKKVLRNHVKAEATDKHPAQVEVYTEDVPVGTWTKTEFSGAIPADDKAELVKRVSALADAVKMAREQANTQEVTDRKVGTDILDYLFQS